MSARLARVSTLAEGPMDDRERIRQERFHESMLLVYADAKSKAGYNAVRFLQMVRRRGGLETAHRLLAQPGVSAGFVKLRDAGRLDLSMEFVVLEPYFASMFADSELAVARERLLRFGIPPSRLPS